LYNYLHDFSPGRLVAAELDGGMKRPGRQGREVKASAFRYRRTMWIPVARVAKTKEEVIGSAGTKYGTVAILKELRGAVVDHGLRRLCLVGSPCHIQSIRYLRNRNLPLASAITLTIGLFCRENYEYPGIERKVMEMGLSVEEINRFNVHEEFDICADGKNFSLPIAEVKNFIPKHCLVCEDYASELADISIGSDGSPQGWSTVVLRTSEGSRVFSELEKNDLIETRPLEDFDYVKEIAERKRQKGKQTQEIFRSKEQNHGEREIAARLGITVERVVHRLKKF